MESVIFIVVCEAISNVPNEIFICLQQRLYKASFEKNRGNFKYTSDTPFFQAAKQASVLINDVSPFFFSPPITETEKLIYAANKKDNDLLNASVK